MMGESNPTDADKGRKRRASRKTKSKSWLQPSSFAVLIVTVILNLVLGNARTGMIFSTTTMQQYVGRECAMNSTADHAEGTAGHQAEVVESSEHTPRMLMEPGRVYVTGRHSKIITLCLFPDFNFSGDWKEETPLTPNDIVVYGMHSPLPGDGKMLWGKEAKQKPDSQRPGKILFHNAEAFGDIWEKFSPQDIGDRFYQIGPISHLQRNNSYRMHLMTRVAQARPSPDVDPILHPEIGVRRNSTRQINGVLYKHSQCIAFRNRAARRLSEFLDVYHGKCKPSVPMRNNSLFPDTVLGSRGSLGNNFQTMGQYKYCLVMENVVGQAGYITEKLMNGFLGGCLPIYTGSRIVHDIFNPKSFVYYDVTRPDEALDLIRRMEANESLYNEYNNAPLFLDPERIVNQYFSACDGVGDGSLKRKIRQMMKIEE